MARTGRPRVGERISLRLPDELLESIDARAVAAGVSRAEAIRVLLGSALAGSGDDGVDRTQIAHRLALSPAHRLRRMAEETRRLLALTGWTS